MMLVRLRAPLDEAQKALISRFCKDLGLEPSFVGSSGEILELTGPPGAFGPDVRSRLEDNTLVKAVLDASDAPELHARSTGSEDPVAIGDARFGGGWVSVVAGPCAVQSRERLLEISRSVKNSGATLLRGGSRKPRTSPYSFQGLGDEALELLAEARAETGLPIVTEVLDPRDVESVAATADVFQIGSRSMANTALLTEVGRTQVPVLLKRGMAATVREFLLAAEYVLGAGNPNVILCERGVRGFDNVTRNLLDVGAIAHLKAATHLPVVADPSHAAGRADLVVPLARAGIAAGADGLLIEVHPAPEEARSDGAQALSLATFERLVSDVRTLVELDGRRLALPREAQNSPPARELTA